MSTAHKGQTGADPLDDFSLYIGPTGIFLDWTDSLWALSLCGCWGICLCCHHRSQQPSLQLCCHIFTPTDVETHDQVGWNKQSICGLVYAGWVASVRGTTTAVKLQPWTHNRTQSRQVYRWVQPGRENLILVLELILKTQELLVLIFRSIWPPRVNLGSSCVLSIVDWTLLYFFLLLLKLSEGLEGETKKQQREEKLRRDDGTLHWSLFKLVSVSFSCSHIPQMWWTDNERIEVQKHFFTSRKKGVRRKPFTMSES